MTEYFKKSPAFRFTIVMFLFFTIWWLFLRFTTSPDNVQNQFFAAIYGLMALWGGIWGIHSSFKWGGIRSIFGKSIMMFSFGLILQEFGQLTYSYYIYFAHIDVPYPSIGDLGYFGSIP